MPYFAPINYVLYPDFQDKTKYNILKNITTRVIKQMALIDDKIVYYDYTMSDHESIESISKTLYGTPAYYWTILIINRVFDKFYNFPLSASQFTEFIVNKYGSITAATTSFRYFIKASTYTTNYVEVNQTAYTASSDPTKYSTSLYDDETNTNETKRTFKVINPKYVNQFVKLYSSLANQ